MGRLGKILFVDLWNDFFVGEFYFFVFLGRDLVGADMVS